MKAVVLESAGLEGLKPVDRPVPEPGPGEVVVRLRAASLNYRDLVTVRMAKYSVPARLIGRQVRVSLRASEVVIFDGREEVARHERVVARGGESIVLDHYLEVLRHKPGALPGSTALAAARQAGVFTAAHEAFWQETWDRLQRIPLDPQAEPVPLRSDAAVEVYEGHYTSWEGLRIACWYCVPRGPGIGEGGRHPAVAFMPGYVSEPFSDGGVNRPS